VVMTLGRFDPGPAYTNTGTRILATTSRASFTTPTITYSSLRVNGNADLHANIWGSQLSILPQGAGVNGVHPVFIEVLDASNNVIGVSNTVQADVRQHVLTNGPGPQHLTEGQAFPAGLKVTATGGRPPYTYSIAENPPWLSVGSDGTLIASTTSLPETLRKDVEITVKDGDNRSDTWYLDLEVRQDVTGMPVVMTLNEFTPKGQFWAKSFASYTTPTVPYASIRINADDILDFDFEDDGSGTEKVRIWPDNTGTYPVFLEVLNDAGRVIGVSNTVQAEVVGAISVSGPSDLSIVQGTAFPSNLTFSATGGTGAPYTYTLASGAPSWLTINPTTGTLGSTVANPPVTALSSVYVGVTDSTGRYKERRWRVEVKTVPVVMTLNNFNPQGEFTAPNTYRKTYASYTAPSVTYSSLRIVAAAHLDSAFENDPADGIRKLRIWPEQLGTFPVYIEVLDASNNVVGISNTVQAVVRTHLLATAPSALTLNVGDTFPANVAVTASGGSGTYTYSLVSGAPSWLTIASDGRLGSNVTNPPQTAATAVTIRVRDNEGRQRDVTWNLEVRVPAAPASVWVLTGAAPWTTGLASLNSIAAGADGAIYVAGTATASGTTSNPDTAVVRLNDSGQIVWSRTYGGSNLDGALGLAVAADGSVYVPGYNAVDDWNENAALAKFDSSGTRLWARTLGGGQSVMGSSKVRFKDVTLDSSGNVYALEANDWTIAKYAPDGTLAWQRYARNDVEGQMDIATDPSGNFFTVGRDRNWQASGTAYLGWVSKHDPSGNLLWSRNYVHSDSEEFAAVKVGPDGMPLLVGTMTAAAAPNDKKILVAKVAADGLSTWHRTLSSDGIADQGTDLAVTSDGQWIYVTGTTRKVGAAGTDTDVFVAKYAAAGAQQGGLAWQKIIRTTGNDTDPRIAVLPTGEPILAFQQSDSGTLSKTYVMKLTSAAPADGTFGSVEVSTGAMTPVAVSSVSIITDGMQTGTTNRNSAAYTPNVTNRTITVSAP